jgi:CBS-domain-containing membrane protein
MLVHDVMRSSQRTCSPATNLGVVMEMLRTGGCDAVPVKDAAGKIVGIVSGTDICIALGTTNRRPSELTAEQVMSRNIATCGSRDDIHTALGTMRSRNVRCLPVLDGEGGMEGMLCLSDLIVSAEHHNGRKPQLSYEDVMGALKGIHWQRSLAASGGGR